MPIQPGQRTHLAGCPPRSLRGMLLAGKTIGATDAGRGLRRRRAAVGGRVPDPQEILLPVRSASGDVEIDADPRRRRRRRINHRRRRRVIASRSVISPGGRRRPPGLMGGPARRRGRRVIIARRAPGPGRVGRWWGRGCRCHHRERHRGQAEPKPGAKPTRSSHHPARPGARAAWAAKIASAVFCCSGESDA